MLAVTERAISAIQQLENAPDVPDGTGLRISSNPADGSLNLTLATAPAQGDEVIAPAGARLFLDSTAAAALEDKTMDAVIGDDGRVQFNIIDQPG